MFAQPNINFKSIPMNPKIKTSQKIYNSTKQNFHPLPPFLSTSVVENKSNEVRVSSKEDSFVVEWQMDHPVPGFSQGK